MAVRKGRRILGIDPGSVRTGYGLIELSPSKTSTASRSQPKYVASGCISVGELAFAERLGQIYHHIGELIQTYAPTEFAVEQVFVARNPQSALKLGQARGVAIAAGVAAGLEIHEYAARQVKQAVVGTGRANKEQVQHMVQVMLGLSGKPQADAADALAIALCHVNTAPLA